MSRGPGRHRPAAPPAAIRPPHPVAGPIYPVFVLGLAVALVVVMLIGVTYGSVHIPFGNVWRVVLRHLTWFEGAPGPITDEQIVWQFRVPRVLLGALVGAALAVAGAALQTAVRNPLADPYTLGVASGASLGAVAAIVLGAEAVGGLGRSGAAFVGALLALAAVFWLGRLGGQMTATRLILAGVALSYVLSAATSYLQILARPQQLAAILYWLLGDLSQAAWEDLGLPAVVLVVALACLLVQSRGLNALMLGEESATALGISPSRLRLIIMVASSLLVAVVVSVAGAIGFVGLMIPHIVRMLVGPDHRRVLPVTALLGATFLVLADLVARTARPPAEIPIGIITAALGGPFFIWLLRRNSQLQI